MKNFKLNYLVIIVITLIVSFSGSLITDNGMAWYNTLTLPEITPPGSFIGIVWTIIFILTALSAIILWNHPKGFKRIKPLVGLFLLNAFLNVFWSFLFFGLGLIGWAIIEMVVLNLTVLAIIILSWRISKAASLLLVPYFVWVCFATYLAYSIWQLN